MNEELEAHAVRVLRREFDTSMPVISEGELLQAAARAGFGANQRNTLLVKLILFAEFIGVKVEKR